MKDQQILIDTKHDLLLPCSKSPIRFAIRHRNGLTSNAWGVQVENTGDAYIYCRDHLKGQHISLHKSGKQHISFDEALSSRMNMSGRFMNQWHEPQYEEEAIAALKLLFPSDWSIGLSEEQRVKCQSTWNKNDIFIHGHDQLMTVVSFVIVDDGVSLRKKEGSYPIRLFGDLPLMPGKRLKVIAGWEPEGNWKATVEEALTKIDASSFGTVEEREDLSICLTGDYSLDSKFLVVVPVKIGTSNNEPETLGQSTSSAENTGTSPTPLSNSDTILPTNPSHRGFQ